MLMTGENITAAADVLRKVEEDYLYHAVLNPRPFVEARIRQLRAMCHIDPKQYAVQKRCLPYVVCGIFKPCYRRKENFAYAETFIIDIDKLSAKGIGMEALRGKMKEDDRVMMCFASPGGDGLKVMFRLRERCYDPGIYSIFYKAFLAAFSRQYSLEQVVDSHTSDVSRACFLSSDPDAYFNPGCVPVDLNAFADTSNPAELFDMKRQQEKEERENIRAEKAAQENTGPEDPEDDILDRIKQRLNPKARKTAEQKNVFVPSRLEEIIGPLTEYVEETGLVVTEVINIQYGKKIRVKAGQKEAEINLFYGKRGFSVVKSPRCGTNGELNEAVANLILLFIEQLQE